MGIVTWFNLGQSINNVFEVEKVKTTGYNIASGYNYVWLNNLRKTIIDGKSYFTSFFSVSASKDTMLNVISYPGEDNMSNFFTQENGSIIVPSADKKPTVNTFNYSKNATGWVFKDYKVNGNSLNKSVSGDFNVTERNQCYLIFIGVPTFGDFPESYGWCYYGPSEENSNIYSAIAFVASRNFWESGILPPFGDVTPGGSIGGYGTYDDTSDTYPTPPNILNDTYKSIFGTGAGLSVYALSNGEYHTFLTNIYNPTFFQTWENTIFNPVNGIYSCIRVPFTQTNLTLENVSTLSISHTNFDMTTHRIINGFVYDEQIDDGHTEIYNVNEYFGSYLDYAPYTTAELIIPFYGSISLDINEIMGGSVKITRRCNYLNGDFTVFVQCTNRFGISNTHTYSGNAAFTLPIVSGDTGMLNKMLDGVASVVNGLAGNVGGAISKTWDALNEGGNVQETQRFSGGAGWMATRNFYLIIRRVCQSNPENYTKENGRQADEFVKFSDLQGYTEVSACDLKFPSGKITPAEIEEIDNLLKQGVFF